MNANQAGAEVAETSFIRAMLLLRERNVDRPAVQKRELAITERGTDRPG